MLAITDESVCSALIAHGERVKRVAGEILFEQGKPSTGLYLVLSGSVRTSLGDVDAGTLRTAKAGSLLGVPATINGTEYSLSAVVADNAELIHVSREHLVNLMRSNPAVSLAIVDILSKEVRAMRQELKKPCYS